MRSEARCTEETAISNNLKSQVSELGRRLEAAAAAANDAAMARQRSEFERQSQELQERQDQLRAAAEELQAAQVAQYRAEARLEQVGGVAAVRNRS